MGHTLSKKVQLLPRQATEYFPNSLGDHQEFSGESFSAVVFVLEKNAGHFPQSLSYGRVMNTDLRRGKWDLRFSGCCSAVFCDLLTLSLRSWGNFGQPPRFTTVPCLLLWWPHDTNAPIQASNLKLHFPRTAASKLAPVQKITRDVLTTWLT